MSKKPNILIFMTDQERADVTMSDHPCQTPHLDEFSKTGVRFNNTFTTMAHCCPSRASFMTGLYPSQHGIHNNVSTPTAINKALKPGVTTFSEGLKEDGYSLYYSGKWHVSGEENPSDRGWEELYVTGKGGGSNGKSIDDWRSYPSTLGDEERKNGHLRRPGWGAFELYGTRDENGALQSDTRVVNAAVDKLGKLSGTDEPWCMFVGVIGPHDPFIVPEKYVRMYDPDQITLPKSYYHSGADKPGVIRKQRSVWSQLSEREVKEATAHYYGYCTLVDEWFGQVLSALEATGQSDDTIVVFLSDHGESLGHHGLFLKGLSPYDETYRVPCVVRWPSGIKDAGREVNEPVSMMDFAPTFLEAAGVAAPIPHSKGLSLLPWLRGDQPESWREAVFNQCNGVEAYYTQRFVRTKQWKFVYHPTDIEELYNLEEDPEEMVNLAADSRYESVKEEMYARIWREMADVEDMIFNNYPTVNTASYGPSRSIGR